MKKQMTKYCPKVIFFMLICSLPCYLGFKVAGEYANQDACGNDYLPNADDNVHGFVDGMISFGGHSRQFIYGNVNFWPSDLVDCSVSGGGDCSYGDQPTVLFLHSHGGSTKEAFRITGGKNQTIDGTNTCRAYTYRNGKQWWKLGDKNLRYLLMNSCHSLELAHLSHWDGVAQGLHILTGGDGDLYDLSGRGMLVAFYTEYWFNMTIKSAWFATRDSRETVVVMAYGSSRNDAINRRDHEKFGWSLSRVSPVTWRAWSWID